MLNFVLLGQGQHRWPWVYAHGKAEDVTNANQRQDRWEAPDLIECDQPLCTDVLGTPTQHGRPILSTTYHVTPGEHPATVHGVPATLFLWETREREEERTRLLNIAAEYEKDATGDDANSARWLRMAANFRVMAAKVSPRMTGLVCLNTDAEAIEQARRKLAERPYCL